MRKSVFRRYFLGMLAVVLSSTGCTPQKAEAIRASSAQFANESKAALQALDSMIVKETLPVPRTDSEISEEFVRLVSGSTKTLDAEAIELSLDPYTVNPSIGSAARVGFVREVSSQYAAFGAMFVDLPRGSFFAKDAVARAVPPGKKLTAQLLAFAREVNEHPPQFLQQRAQLLLEFENVRTASIGADEKRSKLLALRDRWVLMRRMETDLQREVVEKCLKAAAIGIALEKQLRDYERLSLKDVNDLTIKALNVAGDLTGKDMKSLHQKSQELFVLIEQDPAWKGLLEEVSATLARNMTAGKRGD